MAYKEGNNRISKDMVTLAAVFVIYGMAQAVQEYRVLLMSNQGMSAAECGYVLAAASLLIAFARPLSGALADKLRSRRGIFIVSCIVWFAVMIVLALFNHVRIASFVLCAGVIPVMGICNNVTYGMVEAEGVISCLRNGRIDYSIIRMCLSIGYCGINFLYTPIVNRFGDTAPFWITAFWVVILMILGVTQPAFGKDRDVVKTKEKEKLNFSALFKNYFLITFVLASFFQYLGGCTNNYIVYLLQEVGLDSSLVGLCSGIRVAGEIMIMPFIALIKRRVSLPMLQMCACGFQVVQMIICIFCRTPWILVGCIVFSGLASGITLSTTVLYLREMAPEGLVTTTMSLCSITQNLGSVLSAVLGGIIIDNLGIFSLYKLALACFAVWFTVYIGSWCIGKYVMKKEPPLPMLLKRSR